jgi:rubrerythrin
LAEDLEKAILYKKPSPVAWKCAKCGHIHVGETAPKICPVCAHPQGYFSPVIENY